MMRGSKGRMSVQSLRGKGMCMCWVQERKAIVANVQRKVLLRMPMFVSSVCCVCFVGCGDMGYWPIGERIIYLLHGGEVGEVM